MRPFIKRIRVAAERGVAVKAADALAILKSTTDEIPEIMAAATCMRRRHFGDRKFLCSIVNAKSGACPEDCKFCAQSAKHNTGIKVYDLLKPEEMVAAYKDSAKLPISHFGVITSGTSVDAKRLQKICQAVKSHKHKGLSWCASLGEVPVELLRQLHRAGVKRYHHNLETAESYFPNICSTHSYQDRLGTIRSARKAGLEICSGGILGMGESEKQRVEFAMTLSREKVDSIPLNFLMPIKGTKLGHLPPMAPLDILRCIAMFRMTNPRAEVKVCAGRTHMRDVQSMLFYAGATGMMVGPLLTVAGRDVAQDLQMLKDLELEVVRGVGIHTMRGEGWIKDELKDLSAKALDRKVRTWPGAGGKITLDGRTYLNLSSNDYLDLANNPEVKTAARNAVRDFGAGSTASRLLCGTLSCHDELEKQLAAFKGYESALVFGSGWLTNAGVIPALVDREDAVFADRLVHASIIDATILSRATLYRFDHNDPEHLADLMEKHSGEFKKKLVVTESVFSMDGDVAPLEEICSVVDKTDAMLMVDEAHSTGVFGPAGSGLVRMSNLESRVNISMGTMSKAFGGYGGFVACSSPVRDLLVNKARSFIYTTALPPAVIGAALGALGVVRSSPDLGSRLLENAATFRKQLRSLGLDTLASASQIVPVLVGDAGKAVMLSRRLMQEGIIALAVRPPTVPPKTARIRLSVTLAHSRGELTGAADVIARCYREVMAA